MIAAAGVSEPYFISYQKFAIGPWPGQQKYVAANYVFAYFQTAANGAYTTQQATSINSALTSLSSTVDSVSSTASSGSSTSSSTCSRVRNTFLEQIN